MKRTAIYALYVAILSMALASCSSNDFKVDLHIANYGTRNVRVVYAEGENITDTWATVQDDRLKFKGTASAGATVISVYSDDNNLIFRAAVENGDKLIVRGDADFYGTASIKGNKTSEQWLAAKNEINGFAGDESLICKYIEEWVDAHPKSMVSTLLVMFDNPKIGNFEYTESLLQRIEAEAKPSSFFTTYLNIKTNYKEVIREKVPSMDLYTDKQKWEVFTPHRPPYSVILFWRCADTEHAEFVDSMKAATKRWKRIEVVDINFDTDSTMWKNNVKTDSAEWIHFWSPAGPQDRNISRLKVYTTPMVIIADSLGNQVYRGSKAADIYTTLRAQKRIN